MNEMEKPYGFWSRKIVLYIIAFLIVTIFVNWYLFHENFIPWPFIVCGFLVAAGYFMMLNKLLHKWLQLPEKDFIKRLFLSALVIRVLAVVFFYFFFIAATGIAFEYNPVDSLFYHRTAQKIADHFQQGDFQVMSYTAGITFSDLGFNIYLGALYALFGPSLIITRLIAAGLSSLTVVLVYRIAKNIDATPLVTRTAGISAMLLPNFLVYLGSQLKETLMVFLITAFVYLTITIIRNQKRSAMNIALLLSVLFSLFMIRTVLASIAVFTLAGYGAVSHPSKRRIINMAVTVLLLAGFGYIILHSQIGVEIAEFLSKAGTSQSDNMRFRAERDFGNKYALMAGIPLFISIILMAPFPSFVYVPFQEFIWLLVGGNFIRNIYAFFLIVGIVYSIRHNFRNASILLFYAIGYLLVLASSPFAISERFHLPAVPGLLILAAIGITHSTTHLRKYFSLYLFFIFLVITGWNYIKLSGRL
ncbi:hypothetical protein [Flavihumibacter solisilvae]|uniref:Glycosyltransferase RgtA/B/C/D-like domain-containing protein n=1 Tax=Flavihumibacter solisilvae TaxID=1349421 RepID=A0A0C1IT21_9BACT|nr:hypothetical protein [Flavihumibacter solisilvae]KIC93564.1 hypothetical protein OI18_17685 [Flavihumibacter solisilvae]